MKVQNQLHSLLLLGLVFFVLDRLLKKLFFLNILPSDGPLITYLPNYNLSFSLPLVDFLRPVFYLVVLALILLIIFYFGYFLKKKMIWPAFSFWLILLGSFSNLFDRLEHGFVIDFIDLYIWPVFNIADTMIVGGIIILIHKFELLKFKK